MKKILLLISIIVIFSACICKPVLGGLPEGRQAKVDIQNKDFKGELLAVTSDLIVIRFYDEKKKQDVIMGFPVQETDVCKVQKGCGPIGNLFAKNRKFTFRKNTQTKIQENVADLSHDALWLHDKARVWMAGRCGDVEAASRQRSVDNPFARVDWIGSVLLPVFTLLRHMPVLGWVKPLELDLEKLRRPCRDGLLIALAGPAVSLLLAMAGGGLVLGLNAAGVFPSGRLGNLLISFCLSNAMLAAFNLLPIPPLAGASAVELFLDGDALTAFEEIKPYGFILILAGVYFNFFDFITQPISRLVYSLLGF